MQTIIRFFLISILFVPFLFTGCDRCEVPNCSSTVTIFFRVVDKTNGKDILNDLGGSISDISIKSIKQSIVIQDGRSSNVNYLFANLPTETVNYTLSYNGKSIPFELVLLDQNDKCCKLKQFSLSNVKSDSATIKKDVNSSDTQVYLLPI